MRLPSAKQMQSLLAKVEERRNVLEQSVNSICQGFTPAMFLYGPPGLGKSHLIRSMLDAVLGNSWVLHTAYATPKALVLALAEQPTAIHVFEDCEKMLKTDLTASILRAACGAPQDRDRWITYETANEKLRFKITGGVIIMTNENLSRKNGPMQGVASRFRPITWSMTPDEVLAVILNIAERGFTIGGVKISPKEAKGVALNLLEMLSSEDLPIALDIRLYTEHALPAYAFAKATNNKDWQALLAAKLTGSVKGVGERQDERTDRLKKIALQIERTNLKGGEKLKRWRELTGLGKSIYYRYARVKEAGSTRNQESLNVNPGFQK